MPEKLPPPSPPPNQPKVDPSPSIPSEQSLGSHNIIHHSPNVSATAAAAAADVEGTADAVAEAAVALANNRSNSSIPSTRSLARHHSSTSKSSSNNTANDEDDSATTTPSVEYTVQWKPTSKQGTNNSALDNEVDGRDGHRRVDPSHQTSPSQPLQSHESQYASKSDVSIDGIHHADDQIGNKSPDYPPFHPRNSPPFKPLPTVDVVTGQQHEMDNENENEDDFEEDDEFDETAGGSGSFNSKSSNYFLSEPSVSEDGDSTHRIRAPHILSHLRTNNMNSTATDQILSNGHNQHASLDEEVAAAAATMVGHGSGGYQTPDEGDEMMHRAHCDAYAVVDMMSRRASQRRANTTTSAAAEATTTASGIFHPPAAMGTNAVTAPTAPSHKRRSTHQPHPQNAFMSSPGGNTSLSSWESPAWPAKKQVCVLQFVMPSDPPEEHDEQGGNEGPGGTYYQPRSALALPASNIASGTHQLALQIPNASANDQTQLQQRPRSRSIDGPASNVTVATTALPQQQQQRQQQQQQRVQQNPVSFRLQHKGEKTNHHRRRHSQQPQHTPVLVPFLHPGTTTSYQATSLQTSPSIATGTLSPSTRQQHPYHQTDSPQAQRPKQRRRNSNSSNTSNNSGNGSVGGGGIFHTTAGFFRRGGSFWNRHATVSSSASSAAATSFLDAGMVVDGETAAFPRDTVQSSPTVGTRRKANVSSAMSTQPTVHDHDPHQYLHWDQYHNLHGNPSLNEAPPPPPQSPPVPAMHESPQYRGMPHNSVVLSPTSINPHSVDDSLAMTLSDSEYAGGGAGAEDKSFHSSDRLDWEAAYATTTEALVDDDTTTSVPLEQSKLPPLQLPQRNPQGPHRNVVKATQQHGHLNGHRRNRSGDAAAAKLMTGGVGWKGMDASGAILQYPPSSSGGDDESQESNVRAASRRLPQHRYGRSTPSPTTPVVATAVAATMAAAAESSRASANGDSRQAWIQQMALLHEQTAALDHSQNSAQASLLATPIGSLHSREEASLGEESADDESDEGSSESSSDEGSTSQASNHLAQQNYSAAAQAIGATPYKSKVQSESPFANIGKKSAERAPRSSFLPATTYESDDPKYPTFICPRCKTRQREFFTVANAAGRLEGPGSYLALYFAIYVICSLFIFGLEEGWMPLDCTYFAVITLTTAGLGDFVPTSDVNKIICSIFIYFGVACIGLLLGSYIAGMLDDRARRDRKEKQIEACPNCARIRIANECNARNNRREFRAGSNSIHSNRRHLSERFASEGSPSKAPAAVLSPTRHSLPPPPPTAPIWSDQDKPIGRQATPSYDSMEDMSHDYSIGHDLMSSPTMPSPMQFLGRQSHTRHASFDISQHQNLLGGGPAMSYGTNPPATRTSLYSQSSMTNESNSAAMFKPSTNKLRTIASSDNLMDGFSESDNDESSVTSSSTESSTEEVWDSAKSRIQAGKYVFVTLRLALLNSLVIIAVGCIGFWVIEGFSLVDSWYFATVLLTTVGYGDIVPVTDGGKLFATVYILVAGTILLNNMSSISMIPLELRRRRIERTILTQFGDHLDDAALRELATGPVVQRLRLSANRTDGLDECTREMFSLAMLVRLGKVTEHDIRETFASFRHLDVNNEGVLNSKSIIAGMIAKQRISRNLAMANSASYPNLTQLSTSLGDGAAVRPPLQATEADPRLQQQQRHWYNRQASLPVTENDRQHHDYYQSPETYSQFGERSSLLGLESAGLPDDENISWLP